MIKIILISFVPIKLIIPGMVIISPWACDPFLPNIGIINSINKDGKCIDIIFNKQFNNFVFITINKCFTTDIKVLNFTSLVCGKCKTLLSLREEKYHSFNSIVREFELNLNFSMKPKIVLALKEAKAGL